MGTHPHRSLRIGGTILLGLFLLFGAFSFASAHEEDEMLMQEDSAATTTEGDVSPGLIETSQRLAELNAIKESEGPSVSSVSAEEVRNISIQLGVFGFLLLLLLIQIAFLYRGGGPYSKKLLFSLIVLVVVLPSLYFFISTVYINIVAQTRGPVHWHADFRIYACGEELEPPVPASSFSNKTGTPVLHQHSDKRMHVEGVVVDERDVDMKRFFEVQGGAMSQRSITVPTAEGLKTYTNGDSCPDGTTGVWSVFLYKTDIETNTISKTKLIDFPNYILSPYSYVPPGDCLIYNFGPNIEDTDKICDFYQIAIDKGEFTPLWTQ